MKENFPSAKFPDLKRLTAGLTEVFGRNGATNGKVTVLSRKPNPRWSTFPTEIVTCRLGGNGHGSKLRVFVKYGTKEFDSVYGHRGNVSYEAKVYREVLKPLRTSTPTFYGVYKDGAEASWLTVEYLAGGYPASWSKDPKAMTRSAEWIGKFHAANEKRLLGDRLKFLRKYDAEYYKGWARRTSQLFHRLRIWFPWIPPLCEEFERLLPRLLGAPQTIIHGEYFGSNIIYQRGMSRPADWQSAAVAPGEIDLASLTHSWPRQVVRNCERQYRRARWPAGVPDGFKETLEVARVYMNLRWLGDPGMVSTLLTRRGLPIESKNIFLAMQTVLELHSVGERLGLLQ